MAARIFRGGTLRLSRDVLNCKRYTHVVDKHLISVVLANVSFRSFFCQFGNIILAADRRLGLEGAGSRDEGSSYSYGIGCWVVRVNVLRYSEVSGTNIQKEVPLSRGLEYWVCDTCYEGWTVRR